MLSTQSKTGKKARAPHWWSDIFEYFYPQVELGVITKLARENAKFAKFIKNLPSKCPFERQLWLGDVLILYVPALCKFNPFFPQLMRLKAELIQGEHDN